MLHRRCTNRGADTYKWVYIRTTVNKEVVKHHPLAALAVHHMIPPIISERDKSESAIESMNKGNTCRYTHKM